MRQELRLGAQPVGMADPVARISALHCDLSTHILTYDELLSNAACSLCWSRLEGQHRVIPLFSYDQHSPCIYHLPTYPPILGRMLRQPRADWRQRAR